MAQLHRLSEFGRLDAAKNPDTIAKLQGCMLMPQLVKIGAAATDIKLDSTR